MIAWLNTPSTLSDGELFLCCMVAMGVGVAIGCVIAVLIERGRL